MAVKKRKLEAPSPKGASKPKAEPSKPQNRIRLGSRASIGNRAKLGVKT
tara:strand:- start:695 stop:841 length:147 start_codon:yes stop_codon:yes gene_type:complete